MGENTSALSIEVPGANKIKFYALHCRTSSSYAVILKCALSADTCIPYAKEEIEYQELGITMNKK